MARRRRRRMRRNPDVKMLAVIGGVGIVGFLVYKHFSQPTVAYVPTTAPTKTSWTDMLFGTAQTMLTNKLTSQQAAFAKAEYDKQLAAWKASGKTNAGHVYYMASGECVSVETGRTVNPDACIAAGLKAPPPKPAGLAGLGGYEGGIFSKGTLG